MSWHFSQALEEAYSQASCSDGEQSARLNQMRSVVEFYQSDRTTGVLSRSLSGMETSETSMREAGKSMLCLEDSPAPTSQAHQQTEMRRASRDRSLDSGQSSLGSFAKWITQGSRSLWRTPQCWLPGVYTESSPTWPRWGSMRSGECWERTQHPFAAPTKENVFGSLLATPTSTANQTSPSMMKWVGCRNWVRFGLSVCPKSFEWMMGWPLGWTKIGQNDSRQSVTDKFRLWLNLHGKS